MSHLYGEWPLDRIVTQAWLWLDLGVLKVRHEDMLVLSSKFTVLKSSILDICPIGQSVAGDGKLYFLYQHTSTAGADQSIAPKTLVVSFCGRETVRTLPTTSKKPVAVEELLARIMYSVINCLIPLCGLPGIISLLPAACYRYHAPWWKFRSHFVFCINVDENFVYATTVYCW